MRNIDILNSVVIKYARLYILREGGGEYFLCFLSVLNTPFFNETVALRVGVIGRVIFGIKLEEEQVYQQKYCRSPGYFKP